MKPPQRRTVNELHAVELTTNAISDADMVKPLVSDITYPIAWLSGDGAYDQVKVYDELERRRIVPMIPPRSNAVIWTDKVGNALLHARNEALMQIDWVGLAEWNRIAEATSDWLPPSQYSGNSYVPLEDDLWRMIINACTGQSRG